MTTEKLIEKVNNIILTNSSESVRTIQKQYKI